MQTKLDAQVVCVYSNPVPYRSRLALYREFEQHMLDSGVGVTVVECAFGGRPFELADKTGVQHVGVRANSLVWSKENCLNIGIARSHAKHIHTLDADIRFRRGDWAAATSHALELYPVMQPWSTCYDLGPNDEHLELHTSFCKLVHHKRPIVQGPNATTGGYQFGHPGYGWSWTRDALNRLGGLVETAALGAADHHMAMALIGRVDESIPGYLGEGYKAPLRAWQARATHHLSGHISYVPGTIEHGFHGAKPKRDYIGRWDILRRHAFNPSVDLIRNSWGVIELAGNKPGLRHDLDLYFRSRDEDATTLG